MRLDVYLRRWLAGLRRLEREETDTRWLPIHTWERLFIQAAVFRAALPVHCCPKLAAFRYSLFHRCMNKSFDPTIDCPRFRFQNIGLARGALHVAKE